MREIFVNLLLASMHAAAAWFSIRFALGHVSWGEFEVGGALASLAAFGFYGLNENTVLEQFILRNSRAFVIGSFATLFVLLFGSGLVRHTEHPDIVLGLIVAAGFSALCIYYLIRAFSGQDAA